jgi:hypothetical protein
LAESGTPVPALCREHGMYMEEKLKAAVKVSAQQPLLRARTENGGIAQ